MPCTIINLTQRHLNIPYVDDILEPHETKTYDYVEHDIMTNDSRVLDLIAKKKIYLVPIPGGASSFSAAWDATNPLRIEPFQIWVDGDNDLRMVNGIPTSDMDGFEIGATTYPLQSVQKQTVYTTGITFAAVRSGFFTWWHDQNMASWDDYLQYCFWSFAATTGNHALTWTPLTQFASTDDLFTYMETNLPSAGGVYTENVLFQTFDEVDERDPYPVVLHHRNSLVASMAGRKRWTRKGFSGGYYGVSDHFNDPSYYTNFYGEVGQRLVQTATGILPPTNNDNCVWYPRATRSLWHWPAIGNEVSVSVAGHRGAAWDNTASAWISPAPAGSYIVQSPYLLHEYKKNRVLSILQWPGVEMRNYELNSVTAKVFPCISAGRYYAFLIQPHGGDCWITEYHDTSQYVVTLKLRYSGTYQPRYVGISPWSTVSNNYERLMWSHFDPTGLGSLLIRKQEGQLDSDIDINTVPLKAYVSRRDKTTGRRSKWVSLYQIKRRLRNANFRIEPAF